MTILISGFEPFGGYGINSSGLVVQALADNPPMPIRTALLPVSYDRCFSTLQPHITGDIQAIVMLGMNARESAIHIERLGVNCADHNTPDIDGEVRRDRLLKTGPAAYFSTLPGRRIEERLRDAGFQVRLSMSAGTYVCNALLYLTLHHLATTGLTVPAGFIHLPAPVHPDGGFEPSHPRLGPESLIAAVTLILAACRA
ncbi:pyroglutamyl-peptidase I [bacterium]|nr:pyroglutamyl-peptidase I [candidate division CSSED10-310 bacterium]